MIFPLNTLILLKSNLFAGHAFIFWIIWSCFFHVYCPNLNGLLVKRYSQDWFIRNLEKHSKE